MTKGKVKVAISGALGRMGKELIRAAAASKECSLASAFEQAGRPEIGKDAGLCAGIEELGIKVGADAKAAIKRGQVLIEFTFPEPTLEHLRLASKCGVAAVIGTTGLSDAQKRELQKYSKTIPVLFSANMSLGMNLLFALARQSAQILDAGYDLEVIEAHHRMKKDAPSGTALKLAEELAAGRGWDLKKAARYHREGLIGARPEMEIGISSIRAGDIVGDHTVILAGTGERLELTHRVSSRATFARGALRAAKWLAAKPAGLYSMQDCLELK